MKLASINIERNCHLERVAAFLATQQPDVTCLQEVCLQDLPHFARYAGAFHAWTPMTLYPTDRGVEALGLAIFARQPLTEIQAPAYQPAYQPLPRFAYDPETGWGDTMNCQLLTASVQVEGQSFRVATTHFTWTPDGAATEWQLAAADRLLATAKHEAELIMCGDFNAPRGRATFDKIAAVYTDNIPAKYTGSLDPVLHTPAGHKPYMVDGLFTTPGYRAEKVQLHQGVSDHQAITAELFIVE